MKRLYNFRGKVQKKVINRVQPLGFSASLIQVSSFKFQVSGFKIPKFKVQNSKVQSSKFKV